MSINKELKMKNHLKEKLRNGTVTYGISIGTPCNDIVELASNMSFDWIWFDAEHGPLNTEMLHPMIQTNRNKNVTPLVRVPWNDMVHIKKALDIGAEGLIIPWVNNREQAEYAVRAAKYPPMGQRGLGARFLNIAGYDLQDYIKTANEETFVMIQIETVEAVENLEEILTTQGIDAFLIGPNDLAASMGYTGQPLHPEVEKVVKQIIDKAKELGVPGGYAATTIEINQKRIREGFQWITLGSDLGFLAQGAQAALTTVGR